MFTQPWLAAPVEKDRGRRDKVIYHQYKADRAWRTLRGIDEQVAKAESAVAGKAAVKRNRFIKLTGTHKSVNRDLEAKARDLAGFNGYTTNIDNPTPELMIGAYHQLWRKEKSFRMSKHDLKARSIYHHKRESIDAHLTIVFAALAITRFHRRPHRLVDQEVRPHRTPLPHRPDPRRPARPHRPKTHYPPTYATHSPRSPEPVRTNLARFRLDWGLRMARSLTQIEVEKKVPAGGTARRANALAEWKICDTDISNTPDGDHLLRALGQTDS